MGKIYGLGYSSGGTGEGPYTLNVTENIGGFASGVFTGTNREYITHLLVRYQGPRFTSFTFNGIGSRAVEQGATFKSEEVTFAWTMSNATNVQVGSVSLKDVTNNQTLALNLSANGNVKATITGFVAGRGETRRYRISALDTEGKLITSDLILTGMPAMYYCASPMTQSEFATAIQNGLPLTDQRLAELGISKILLDSKILNKNYVCTGGRYIHIFWDEAYGQAPEFGKVQSGPNPFSAYDVLGVSIIDSFNQIRKYRLLTTGIQFGVSVNINILA